MADALPGAAAPIPPAGLAAHHAHHDRDAVPEPLALLRLLDGWMSSSGMDNGHPWRIAIARTLAADRAAAENDASEAVGADDTAALRALLFEIAVLASMTLDSLQGSDDGTVSCFQVIGPLQQIGAIADVAGGLPGRPIVRGDASAWLFNRATVRAFEALRRQS